MALAPDRINRFPAVFGTTTRIYSAHTRHGKFGKISKMTVSPNSLTTQIQSF